MTIILNLRPELEDRLQRSAAQQGQEIGAYVQKVLEYATAVPDAPRPLTNDDLCTMNADRYLSLLDMEGLGAEIWDGVDAQEYVNEIRREWDHRP